jgi:hypothetical protein
MMLGIVEVDVFGSELELGVKSPSRQSQVGDPGRW